MTFSTPNDANEKVFDHLCNEGYRPKYDDDNDIVVKREGKIYAIIFEENDPKYFRVVYPNFWPLDDEEEHEQALRAAARVNSKMKCAKVLPSVDFDENANVSVSLELYAVDVDGFIAVLDRAFRAIEAAGLVFRKEMQEMRSNDEEN